MLNLGNRFHVLRKEENKGRALEICVYSLRGEYMYMYDKYSWYIIFKSNIEKIKIKQKVCTIVLIWYIVELLEIKRKANNNVEKLLLHFMG